MQPRRFGEVAPADRRAAPLAQHLEAEPGKLPHDPAFDLVRDLRLAALLVIGRELVEDADRMRVDRAGPAMDFDRLVRAPDPAQHFAVEQLAGEVVRLAGEKRLELARGAAVLPVGGEIDGAPEGGRESLFLALAARFLRRPRSRRNVSTTSVIPVGRNPTRKTASSAPQSGIDVSGPRWNLCARSSRLCVWSTEA